MGMLDLEKLSRRFPVAVAIAFSLTFGAVSVIAKADKPNRENMKTRTGQSDVVDHGSIHSMGNGQMVAYGQGPNLVNLFGPPCSSPNFLKINMDSSMDLVDTASREPGTAIWNHTLSSGGKRILTFTEFIDAKVSAYFRTYNAKVGGVRFAIEPDQGGEFVACESPVGAWLLITKPGKEVFRYPTTLWTYHWIIPHGNCRIETDLDGTLLAKCLPGRGGFAVSGANDYPEGLLLAEQIAAEGPEGFLTRTRAFWKNFTKRRESLVVPTAGLEAIADGVATLIKAQQSEDGGVMAGHYYPLAYVRDQYGVAKGMLALGMVDEARMALEFRREKFKRFGNLQNAESMGGDFARHIHENDEVEQTGYIILQARDYFNQTQDNEFIKTLFPMLEWCWNSQLKHLAGGSLAFNGDETYVAGRFFPRSGLLHGSADSTLVFIESGKWLSGWAAENGLWEKNYVARQMEIIADTQKAWRRLFFDGDKVYANAPEREGFIDPPRFRHGVCESHCDWFGWTERTGNGRYQCPLCFSKQKLPSEIPGRMEVNSVSLLPTFIGSDILSREELTAVVEHILGQACENGHIPTIPGGQGCVGYDPGFLLFALSELNHPATEKTRQRLIGMIDDTGAWTEYYGEDDQFKKANCRCRPWESGINAAALLK
ncbi:MAG: hypothetical protein DRP64_01475 [Verrucomicrobia bacterium]|nr:MAG: hypothetical protein DRP64_01475 [Verrucomicrobiota bacterium]